MDRQRFGRLTVVGPAGSDKHRNLRWNCVCDCGASTCVLGTDLRKGHTRSCGCLQREAAAGNTNLVRHGCYYHPLYKTWQNMMSRCYNASIPDFAYYGARGITVHERWHDVATFIKEVPPRPSKAHTLDRMEVNGNYEPGNVRWATRLEQSRNTRAHKRVDVGISRHRDGRFVASIRHEGKRKHLGLFEHIEDARAARAQAAATLWKGD